MSHCAVCAASGGGVVRWIARAWSILSIAFLVAMFVGEGLMNPGESLPRVTEWIGLVLFPGGVLVGLILAWRWEILGGSITTASLIAFYVLMSLASGALPRGPYFALVAAPGILFLLAGALSRGGSARGSSGAV